MGDYVGVDPIRVRKLADRLQDLEGALAKHGALIRKNFTSWESGLDLSLLGQQTQAVGDDARSMSKRADLARNLLLEGDASGMCTPDGDIVNIPWDMADVNAQSAKEATQEAARLKKALDDPKGASSRADIEAIGRSLADHQDDPTYLAAFAAAGGVVDAARVSRALHVEDGTHGAEVLSKDSQNVVAQYATGINRVFTLQSAGKIPPNPEYVKALTNPPGGDMWSVGMLFKYGPKGNEWDTQALTQVSGAMLDWRRNQQMRPSYTKGGVVGMAYTAPAYVDPDNAWYASLGLTHSYNREGIDDAQKRAMAIDANDPSLAVINRLGENADASRHLLGNNDSGKRFAADLVDFHWQTPGAIAVDDSDGPRQVLTLAATDRTPAHIDESGTAAANILAAAAKEKDHFDGRNGHEKDEYPTFPNGTAVALAGITATWADDLGGTGMSAPDGVAGYDPSNHVLVGNNADTVKVMRLFAKDNPGATAMFDVVLHEKVSTAAGSKDPTKSLTDMGNTAGMLTKAKVAENYSAAQQIDEEHKTNKIILDSAGTLFGFIPAPKLGEGASKLAEKIAEKSLKYPQNLAVIGRTIVAPQTDPFSTDNASKQEALSVTAAKEQYRSFIPSIAQGMVRSGAVPPPTGSSWYDPQTGTISSDASHDPTFQSWWNMAHGDNYQKAFKDGFDNAEVSPDGK
ncbi:hypothetical protein DWB77_03331 [Streptomyces hundungensis]|uniref:Uncharacterized protein n=1 Tax=Streptomyces hundungensis TaxID=1077946 RepID=A0A387HCJ6_9ACTN|nr:hypothetical protein DWB77_03331 [Streptomyces hundungensis]